MRFGSISYLNLLPFQLFLKRYLKNSSAKMGFRYKRAVPSRINALLKRKEVDAGFISSIASQKFKCTQLGIIAYKKVYSVLVLPEEEAKDPASATSNALAKLLQIKGRVLIGDAALKHYFDNQNAIDLAEAWHKKTGLPFVFGRLCYNKHGKAIEKLAKKFAHTKMKIPQYILKKEAKKRGITPAQLLWYLEHIYYKMEEKENRSLRLFLKQSKKVR